MNRILKLITFLLLIANGNLFAQKQFTWGLSYGANFQNIKEARFSSNFRSGLGFNTDLEFGWSNEKAWNNLRTSFIYTKVGKDLISPMLALNPSFRFEHIRKKKFMAWNLGAYFDAGSFLGFRSRSWADENFISYAIWSSLGIHVQLDKELENFKKNTRFKFSISNPILSYLIRPASVNFPYPDNFLEQENFNFDLDGLGGSIISSGKLKTLDSFVNLKIQTGFEFQLNDGPFHLGLFYRLQYLYTREIDSLVQLNSQINIILRKF